MAREINSVKSEKNILILYTELAAYTVTCFEALVSEYNVNLHVVRMPVNEVAPFDFKVKNERIFFYNVNDFNMESLMALYDQIKPVGIFCSGWIIKMYLELCKRKRKECITIIGFDTKWVGSLRQIAGSFYARYAISPNFDFAFVPGNSQAIMAQKMGFKNNQIVSGFYATDVKFFNEVFTPGTKRSKVIIFAGRYAKEKGLPELCEVFMELKMSGVLNDWKLWCVGRGSFKIPAHPDILDLGFKQPTELKQVMKEPGIFILPSTYEPWGVVVHEFAAAGFPMICSDKVGATEIFLEEGKNGFLFKGGDKSDLKDKLKKMCNLNAEKLKDMSSVSFNLSQKITPSSWAHDFYKMIYNAS